MKESAVAQKLAALLEEAHGVETLMPRLKELEWLKARAFYETGASGRAPPIKRKLSRDKPREQGVQTCAL